MKLNNIAIILSILILCSCTNESNTTELLNFVNNEEKLIKKAIPESIGENDIFLAISIDICRSCFGEIVNHFKDRENKATVLLIGANKETVDRFNSIYSNSIIFHEGNLKNYNSLKNAMPSKMIGFVRLIIINQKMIIKKGTGANLTERTKNLLEIYTNLEGEKVAPSL